MIQKCSTGHVGIEDSADGSAMLRSTLLVITVALEDTGRPADHKVELVHNFVFIPLLLPRQHYMSFRTTKTHTLRR